MLKIKFVKFRYAPRRVKFCFWLCISLLITDVSFASNYQTKHLKIDQQHGVKTPISKIKLGTIVSANDSLTYKWSTISDALQSTTYGAFILSNGTYKKDNGGDDTFNYWWNAHMLDVLTDGYLRTSKESYVPKMKALVKGIKVKNGKRYKNLFIDDMEWLAISCLRAFEATDNQEFRDVTDLLWVEIKKGWNNIHGGGITWKTDNPYEKNACSNGPATILAIRLYNINKNPDDLAWAEKIYNWEKKTLVDSHTGLVWDNISLKNGKTAINKNWIFSYNVGTYLGAATELYSTTKKRKYLIDAIQTANSTVNSDKITRDGLLKNEGEGDRGLFKGILFRYLALLIEEPDLSKQDRENYVTFLKFNAQTLYDKGLNKTSLLVGPDWSREPGSTTDFSTQLSGVMLMEAVAKLAK